MDYGAAEDVHKMVGRMGGWWSAWLMHGQVEYES